MKTKLLQTMITEDNQLMLMIKVPKTIQIEKRIEKLKGIIDKGKLLKVDIKEYREKRSLDANAYCWVIADKIAQAIGNTKEYVYKWAIRQVGPFEIVPIKDEAVDKWIRNWESKGLGWQSEILGESKLEGYINTVNYYGSSTYNTKEMSLLLEELIYQAKELGIDTMTETEKERLLDSWDNGGKYASS